MNNYHVIEEEGRGKHSVVYKARKKKSLDFVAIKQIDRSQRPKVVNECKILADLNHPNVLRLYDWIETKKHLWIVTEYCPGGDLLTLIEQDKSLPENTVRVFIKEIINGLQYLHSNGVIFSDLKPANVFINQYGGLKLADLGCAKKIAEVDVQPKKGTPCYMSPELFDNGPFSFQSDLWALGCIMYQLAQGHPPFLSSELTEIIQLTKKAQTPKVASFSEGYNDLLFRLLTKDPQRRIFWNQIIKHPWLKGNLEVFQIPQQPQFNQFIKSGRKQTRLTTARKVQQQNYVNEPVNTSNRRQLLKFQGNSEFQNIHQIISKQSSQKNLKTTQKKKTRSIIPQLDDSSNINVDFDKVSRSNLISIQELLIHQSDNVVKPIIGNKDIQIPESFTFSKSNLGFDYIQPEDLIEGLALTGREVQEQYKAQMEGELKKIYDGLLGDNKVHVIGYFETLIQNSDISNFFIKSKFIPLFLKLIKTYKQPILRAKICQILGLIIRHATIIESDILKFGMTNSLVQVLSDKNQKVKRKAMAALGQFLFYAATQVDEGQQIWDLSALSFNSIVKMLKNNNEDELTKFYACKTVQNITAQTKIVGGKFAQLQVAISLIGILNQSKLELLKSSAASAIHHIVILNEALLEPILERITLSKLLAIFQSNQNNGKIIQVLMGIINMQLYKKGNQKFSKLIAEDQGLIKGITRLLDCHSSVVKGRVMLFLNFIIQYNFKNIIYLHQGRFFQCIDKQFKDGQKYVVQCLQYLVVLLQENIGTLLKLVKQSFRRMAEDKKKVYSSSPQANYANLIVSLMNSSIFQDTFMNTTYIDSLFSMLDYFQGSNNENMKNTIFQICQKIVSNTKLTDCLQDYMAEKIFPLLVHKIVNKSQSSDMKFGCMKLLIYLIGFYLPEQCVYNSVILQSTRQHIITLINQILFPSIEYLLEQKQPIPSFTLKLVALLFQLQPSFVTTYKKYNRFSTILLYYNPLSSKLTQHTLKIVHSFCNFGQLSNYELFDLLMSTKQILSHYIDTSQELFIQYPLEIISCTIKALCQQKKENTESINMSQMNIQSIFEMVLPLQGYDDVVMREKATELVKLLLSLGVVGCTGKWTVVDKAGLQNYKEYLKKTNKRADKSVYESIKMIDDKSVQNLVKQIDNL